MSSYSSRSIFMSVVVTLFLMAMVGVLVGALITLL
jgi:putative Ca2+/H+ antiporter (TMEM165/GDT1 family)